MSGHRDLVLRLFSVTCRRSKLERARPRLQLVDFLGLVVSDHHSVEDSRHEEHHPSWPERVAAEAVAGEVPDYVYLNTVDPPTVLSTWDPTLSRSWVARP